MEITIMIVSIKEVILFAVEIFVFISFLLYANFAIAADNTSGETGFL